jgi:hypothetical protein
MLLGAPIEAGALVVPSAPIILTSGSIEVRRSMTADYGIMPLPPLIMLPMTV